MLKCFFTNFLQTISLIVEGLCPVLSVKQLKQNLGIVMVSPRIIGLLIPISFPSSMQQVVLDYMVVAAKKVFQLDLLSKAPD